MADKVDIEDIEFLLSFLPQWVRKVEKGLDATMYGTGTYEGDKNVQDKLKKILKKYKLEERWKNLIKQ